MSEENNMLNKEIEKQLKLYAHVINEINDRYKTIDFFINGLIHLLSISITEEKRKTVKREDYEKFFEYIIDNILEQIKKEE